MKKHKKILFILEDLHGAGAQKSLVSLLSEFKKNEYDISVMVFKREGLFRDALPCNVKIISGPRIIEQLLSERSFENIVNRKVTLSMVGKRFLVSQKIKKIRKLNHITAKKDVQLRWDCWKDKVPEELEQYDIAISYMQGISMYYMVDKIKANKKIGWIHFDYEKLGMIPEYDAKYFKSLAYIVTVSKICEQSLQRYFPQYKSKIKMIENIISVSSIVELANRGKEKIPRDSKEVSVISIGRLSPEKGFDVAIQCLKKLRDDNQNIRWYVIGKGPEEKKLKKLTKQYGVNDSFIFLGEQENPYQFIKQSDIYIQASRGEGKSIAVEEAKALSIPIVVADYPTAKDQIEHNRNGLIAMGTVEGLTEEIKRLVQNKSLRDRFSMYLKENYRSNETEIEKFYELL